MSGAVAIAAIFLAVNALRDIKRREIFFWPSLLVLASGAIWHLLTYGAASLMLSLIPGALLLASSHLSGGRIGAGDGIIALAAGPLLGLLQSARMLIGGIFLAGIAAAILLALGRRGEELPFVPFLLLSLCLWR